MQPKIEARSPMMAVSMPMRAKAEKKANHPPHSEVGGIKANRICVGVRSREG